MAFTSQAREFTVDGNSLDKLSQGDLVSRSREACRKLALARDSRRMLRAPDIDLDPSNVRFLWVVPLAIAAAWAVAITEQVPAHAIFGTLRDACDR